MNIITQDEWRQRYAARLMQSGIGKEEAANAAHVAITHAGEFLTPEDAADNELSFFAVGD